MVDSNQSPEFQRRLAAQIKVHREVEEYSVDDVDLPIKNVYKVTFRRAVAYIMDCALLILVGLIIVSIAGDRLAPVGFGGYWIGIAIAALYFGYFDSKLGCGRSVGKRLMGIEVRRLSGMPLDVLSAVVRFSPFMAVSMLFYVAGGLNPSSIPFAVVLFVLWIIISSIFVLIICHPQRRGLQDLIADSIVIHAGVEFEAKPARLKTPVIILVVLGVIVAAGMISLRWYAFKTLYVQSWARATDSLCKLSDISSPRVFFSPVTDEKTPAGRKLFVFAKVKDYARFADKQKAALLADGIHLALKSSSSIPPNIAEIVVSLEGGYSVGLWSMTRVENFTFSTAGASNPPIQYRVVPGKSQMPKAPPPGVKGKR